MLVVDDTAIAKKGTHSVVVAAQYALALGKTANCQTLVSLTLARGEVPIMLALRLFLPETDEQSSSATNFARRALRHLELLTSCRRYGLQYGQVSRVMRCLDLDDKVLDHSTLSVNRHGRVRDSDILRQVFEAVVRRAWMPAWSRAYDSDRLQAAIG